MTAPAWRLALKAGDVVAVVGSRHGRDLDRVERVTAKQIVLARYGRFGRESGAEIGSRSFSRYYLAEATPEVRAAITRERKRERCAREHDLKKATDAELDALDKIFRDVAGRVQP